MDVNLVNLNDQKEVIRFITDPSIKISEALTGLLVSDRNDLILMGSRLVQSAFKVNLFKQLGREMQELRKTGQIKEDYFATNQDQATLVDFLRFIDNDAPDEEIFKVAKSIFFKSISKDAGEEEKLLAYQYLQICKKLHSTELLLLKGCYKIKTTNDQGYMNMTSANDWLKLLATESGLKHTGLIELAETKLIENKLVNERNLSDRSGIPKLNPSRLTELGIDFCQFITAFK